MNESKNETLDLIESECESATLKSFNNIFSSNLLIFRAKVAPTRSRGFPDALANGMILGQPGASQEHSKDDFGASPGCPWSIWDRP